MVYVDGGSTHPRSTHVHSHLYKLNGNDSDVEHGIALNFFSSTYSIKPNATHCTSSTEIPGEAWARKHVYSRWIKIKKIFSFFHHLQQYIIIKFIESVKIWLSEQLQPSMKWMESGMSALASSLLATSNTNMFAEHERKVFAEQSAPHFRRSKSDNHWFDAKFNTDEII